MDRKLITKQLLRTVYLTLQQYGYPNVSLKREDLLEYVPKIEKLLNKAGLLDTDLFVKTPVEETYDEYKNFLIKELYGGKLGSFNESYDTIILNCPNYFIYRCQKQLEDYNEVIHKCCYVISNDIKFIDDDIVFELLSLNKDAEGKKEDQFKLNEAANSINEYPKETTIYQNNQECYHLCYKKSK